jgi:hypothetical protein
LATPTPKPSPSSTPRVGGNKYTPGAVQPQPVAAPAQAPAGLSPEAISQIQQIVGVTLSNVGTTGTVNPAFNYTLLESISDAELTDIARLLKKMGFTVKGSKGSIKELFATDPALDAILRNSSTPTDLKTNLLKDYLPLGGDGTENLPTRTISKQDPVVLGELIDKVYQSKVLRRATAEEKAQHIKNFQDDIDAGTLTTTKKIKNKKTGKMENVTTVESNFSQAKAETEVEQSLRELNPDDLDRAKRIQFSDFIMQNTMGGQ